MVDIAGNASTTAEISVGETRLGTIETVFDEDWYRLDLTAGETVTITLCGIGNSALLDPILDLYDFSGALVAWNYDIAYPTNKNASLIFEAPTSGSYFVDAYGSGEITGDYLLSVDATSETPLDAIDWGTQVSGNAVSVYFAPEGISRDGYQSDGWTDQEIQAVKRAFDLISSVANLTFEETTAPNADFQLVVNDHDLRRYELGFFYPPDEPSAGIGVFNGAVWSNRGLQLGGFDLVTITHELLHGLGLAHPHDGGGSSAIMDGVNRTFGDVGDFQLNQGIYTTMTYNEGFRKGPVGTVGKYAWGNEAGPMALDIAVLQAKYGANTTFAAEDSTYILPDENGRGTYYGAIWDTGGLDELLYMGARNTNIDLREASLLYQKGGGGWLSAAEGIAGGFTIANGVVIENATSDQGHDRLRGNSASNVLSSGNGNDRLIGGGGDDTLAAGRGQDRVKGGAGDDLIALGGGRDTFVFRASDGADVIADFNLEKDLLLLDAELVDGPSRKTTLLAGALVDANGVWLMFDGGESILLADLNDKSGLRQAISFDFDM